MKYRTIVIDPPWDIKFTSLGIHGNSVSSLPYETMTDNEISQFPLNDYADDNCSLFIWTTQSKLLFTFKLAELWGFKTHCLMTWDKVEGMNNQGFTRNSEFVLFCYKGKFDLNLNGKFIPTSFRERRTSHSAKPRIFYDMLLRVTHEPRIDIFSRKKHHGFDSWGNEAEEPLTLHHFT
jgi:N6-adenosine-specific RNA methylase IME4